MNETAPAKGHRRIVRSRGVVIKLDRKATSPDPDDQDQVRDWLQTMPRPWAVDLYAGAGGLSLGLSQAGFSVVAAADQDLRSIETHAHNMGGLAWVGDLGDPEEFLAQLASWGINDVDLVAGGPPCQPFSHAGNPKIANLVRSGARRGKDGRASLWRSFLKVIDHLDAKAVLIENVPGFASIQSGHTLTTLLSELEERGYWTDVRVLQSWQYGVPQLRKRLFVVGLRKGHLFQWPSPSESKTTVRQAIGDLPVVEGGQRVENLPYDEAKALSEFAQRMRKALDESELRIIRDHITRFVREDDAEIFAGMKPGQTYRDVPEHLRRYRADIFTDKYNRLTWDGLSRTITAHLAKDGYWYIHPQQNRTLSIREAARIQTFPDSFRFAGSPSNRYQQIGNAVPPLLAESVGVSLHQALEAGVVRDSEPRYSGTSVREQLMRWHRRWQRTFDWRRESNPWHILLAEICLRRTRANQVADYFPSLRSVASTPGDVLKHQEDVREVLSHLGILSRADDLIKLASRLIEDYGGAVPESYGDLKNLPGVGDYIASAVLCFAFHQPTTLIDANTKRIARRFSGRQRMAPWEQRLMLHRLAQPGVADADWNYALLDLGALVCRPNRPNCEVCPINSNCSTGRVSRTEGLKI